MADELDDMLMDEPDGERPNRKVMVWQQPAVNSPELVLIAMALTEDALQHDVSFDDESEAEAAGRQEDDEAMCDLRSEMAAMFYAYRAVARSLGPGATTQMFYAALEREGLPKLTIQN